MQHRQWAAIGVLGLGLAMGTRVGAAENKAAAPAGMDPATQAKMQAYMTPGPAHRALDPIAGNWKAKTTFWMKPGDKPEITDGTAENTWVLNGHHLKTTYHGTWGGQPFEGWGTLGYDNFKEEYQSVWLDSMGTGTMYTAGKYDPAKKVFALSGTMACPMTGDKNMPYRSELKIISPEKHTYTSYSNGPDGKEYKNMEIVYTRAK